MTESEFLKSLAKYSGSSIQFKNEELLPGTGWINDVPIDISISGGCVILNSIGEFRGNAHLYSKSLSRGRGNFSRLVPYLKKLLLELGFEQKIYLTPLSPVWGNNYKLCEAENPHKTDCSWYIDLS